MNSIMIFAMIFIAAFASYKLAEEKGQHKIIWPVVTLFVGPIIFIVQYLVTVFSAQRKTT